MVFVYLVEQNLSVIGNVRLLFKEMNAFHITPVCSVLLLSELFQQPIRNGNWLLLSEYQRILLSESSIEFVDVTKPVAVRAATLAGRYRLKTLDAAHIACALEVGATAFVTADKGIKGIKELEIIQL